MLQFMTKLDDSGMPHVNDHLEARYYTNTAIKYGGMGAEIKMESTHGQWWLLLGEKIKRVKTDDTDNGASVFCIFRDCGSYNVMCSNLGVRCFALVCSSASASMQRWADRRKN
jgi:hypothetical protein